MKGVISSADIVYGIQSGDEGKGKVSSFLASQFNENPSSANKKYYSYVVRWAGGANAGHTVYLNSKKYKTHLVPSGVFHGVKSLIGPGCVMNPSHLRNEIDYLDQNGFDTSLLKISPMTHIVTDFHIEKDISSLSKKLGTTSRGIAPAYADKYARSGFRFSDLIDSDPYWRQFLHTDPLDGNILCEGAQGFYLDINWGNYPFVTSSETLPYAACSIGFSPKKIRNIFAVAKIYETRSGEDPLFPESLFENPELLKIGEVGKEYGVTTGRRRKVNYLLLNRMIDALNIGGGDTLIISKCDILEETKIFKLFYNEKLITFDSIQSMKDFIECEIYKKVSSIQKIIFSSSPEKVEGLSLDLKREAA